MDGGCIVLEEINLMGIAIPMCSGDDEGGRRVTYDEGIKKRS